MWGEPGAEAVPTQDLKCVHVHELWFSPYRLSFLSSVVGVFTDRIMLCPSASKIAFCNGCVRYSSYTYIQSCMYTCTMYIYIYI